MLRSFIKAITSFIAPRGRVFPGGSGQVGYRRKVGEGYSSSVVMAPLFWIARTFPQAILRLKREGDAVEHSVMELLNKPNGFYSLSDLWTATIFSYVLSGNAYWLIVRNPSTLRPEQLWYIPHWLIEPASDQGSEAYLTHYNYRPKGRKIRLEIDDVIHFRYGIDPQRITQGISPLQSLYREVFTDDEAAAFSAAMVRNTGMAGLLITPKDKTVVSDKDLTETRNYVEDRVGGSKRGKAMVLSSNVDVKQMGFNPQQLALGELRDIPEERVCAVLGIPAAVVGFGTGLQQTKVGAVLRDYIRMAWDSNLIPMAAVFADTLTNRLLPEFEARRLIGLAFEFDTDHIKALQDDEKERSDRTVSQFTVGMITRAEAKTQLGFESGPGDEIYLIPASAIEVAADGSLFREGDDE